MDNSTKSPTLEREGNTSPAHLAEAASDLLNESKKYAHELYEQGRSKVTDAQDNVTDQVKEHSDQLIKMIQKNPIGAVLVAAGVGVVLSALFKK